MIKIRLIRLLSDSKKYIIYQIAEQWLSLLCQIVIIYSASVLISQAVIKTLTLSDTLLYGLLVLGGILLRYGLDILYAKSSFKASSDVKRVLRNKIYSKLLRLGTSYREKIKSSEVMQMAGEGVEQLEVYFGRYLSQFFYALLAPLTLFICLLRVDFKASLILLAAVPLIPIVIMIVMKVAKKLLDKYFTIYYGLGDTFLEKLHGMTTLKIYGADEQAALEMDQESEQFRKITMKVLMMQLNSTAVMDIVAYGGAAVGMVVALMEYYHGAVSLKGTILIVLLAAEFFLPMRLLGSFFHIGMNGMKASDRIFAFLDLPEANRGDLELDDQELSIDISHMSFSYNKKTEVLKNISMNIKPQTFVSIVGVSGSGKSTIAKILIGQNKTYQGDIKINDISLLNIKEESLLKHITMVSFASYLFKGTIRDNLLMGNPEATDSQMMEALKQVNLYDFICSQDSLDTKLLADASNLSGGQRQRLALARALLHDSEIYLFDEATSNIDMESEEMIMHVIRELAKKKTVILISHRLANVVNSDYIYMLKDGVIYEEGTHEQLMNHKSAYYALYSEQKELESYSKKGENHGE
ncbi:ABC transporter ATP-binding protein/permease [Eggerthia catenaformis]|uniref:ABC transporter ATP-binding protein/permease n=1 Tax=Eggerthia catenaformis TaxID=31973 RepID=UPI00047B95AB|nr:ABC transporter ATP-binding protein/permease [Eggerthia catenaformis]